MKIFSIGYLAITLSSVSAFSFVRSSGSRSLEAFFGRSQLAYRYNYRKTGCLGMSSEPSEDGNGSADEGPISNRADNASEPVGGVSPSPSPNLPLQPKQPRVDPLMASLIRTDQDPSSAGAKGVSESEKRLLFPALGFAAIGALLGIFRAFNSTDEIAAGFQQTTDAMSKPPTMKTKKYDNCRGICSSQDEQLESMRGFMNQLSKKNREAPLPAVSEPPAASTAVVEDVVVVEDIVAEPTAASPAE